VNTNLGRLKLVKTKLFLSIFVGLSWSLTEGVLAQSDSLTGEVATVTHWSTNLRLFESHDSYSWDFNAFDDPVLDTSNLVISRASLYEAITLATSFSTRGFENEWNIALGKLTNRDDLIVLDIGIGGVFGSIPKTMVSNQVASISYYSNSPGNPLKQGTATYTYSIDGSYVEHQSH
jgi:hypothetical protein